MKVLLVNKFHWYKGGSEKYYFELAKLLKENGHEIAFFSMKNEKNINTGEKEYFVNEIDLNSGSKLKALDVIYSKDNYQKMKEAIEDFKPDIVHINNFQRQLSSSIIKAITEKKIPILYTAHDANSICPASAMLYNGNVCEDCINIGYRCCIKKKCIKDSKLKSFLGVIEHEYYSIFNIYKKINCIIAPSEFMKRQLIKGGLKCNNIVVINNFVLNTNTTNNKDKGYAFYFGRLSVEKGIINLVNAFKYVEKGKLLIAGSGPEKERIKSYINENNLNNRVELLGYLNQDEIRHYISESRFVVVPSVCNENCPYSILESLEIGKPVIGSKIGGIPEMIEDNQNGYLYDYQDIQMLAEKMNLLFKDDEKVISFSKKSRELYEEKYSDLVYYKNLELLYNSLLGEENNV